MSKNIKLVLNRETLRVLNHGALAHVAGGEVTKPTICTTVTLDQECMSDGCTTGTITSQTRPTCRREE